MKQRLEQFKPDIKGDRSPRAMAYRKSSEHMGVGQDWKQGLPL